MSVFNWKAQVHVHIILTWLVNEMNQNIVIYLYFLHFIISHLLLPISQLILLSWCVLVTDWLRSVKLQRSHL